MLPSSSDQHLCKAHLAHSSKLSGHGSAYKDFSFVLALRSEPNNYIVPKVLKNQRRSADCRR